ncbi:MAG TPA: response regulator, partial [bacterium]|nr:response regulator [bacterium]
KRQKPDLLILDMVMPELSGYAILDILNAKGMDIPVLVMTTTAEISENLAQEGIAGLLLKPIDPERLLIHVDAIFKLCESSMSMDSGALEVWEQESRLFENLSWPPEAGAADGASEGEDRDEAAAPVIPRTKAPAGPGTGAAGRPLVLVVDDEPDMREILSAMLEHSGFDVILAEDGQRGLAMAQEKLPNAMVLDIMLPRMDGFQVCRLLKFDEKFRDIAIVILTARSLPEDRDLAMAANADAYFTKPVDPDILAGELRRLIATQARSLKKLHNN